MPTWIKLLFILLVISFLIYLVLNSVPKPEPINYAKGLLPMVSKEEVFNIDKNIYTFDDAKALCTAFGARLATLDDLKKAYEKGADWCNYGWSEGQMALYPTSKATWEKLQKRTDESRNDCGHAGINGGVFDNPELKFGVNCFGVKPQQNDSNRAAFFPDYESEEEKKTQDKITALRKNLSDVKLLPFNRNQWYAPS
jgi:hypothetical protein